MLKTNNTSSVKQFQQHELKEKIFYIDDNLKPRFTVHALFSRQVTLWDSVISGFIIKLYDPNIRKALIKVHMTDCDF